MLEPKTNLSVEKADSENSTTNNPTRLDDKKNFEDSTTFDSGYLSSQQIHSTSDIGISSTEIATDTKLSSTATTAAGASMIRESIFDSGVIDDQFIESDYHSEKPIKRDDNSSMIIKSDEIRISDRFSSLSLTPNRNDLDRPKEKLLSNEKPTKNDVMKRLRELCYQQDDDGDTQLHIAVLNKPDYVPGIIRLADEPWMLDIQNDFGQTAMHFAAMSGQAEIVRNLLIYGAKGTLRDGDGNTPLHLACQNGDLKVVKSLTLPISLDEIKTSGITQKYPCGKLPELDQNNYYGENCVHVAANQSRLDVLKHLCYIGADVNARRGTDGYTALHIAIENCYDEMVEFLLSECKTLEIETKTYGLKTAYQLALSSNEKKFIDLLKKYPCDIYSPTNSDDDESFDDSDDSDVECLDESLNSQQQQQQRTISAQN